MFSIARRARPRITVVAAARPNFMKVGPVIRALQPGADVELVHTGQHYDAGMSATFFDELGLPEPGNNLGVGSGTHAETTAAVMIAFERYLQANTRDAVVVVGDVNSTVAAAMAAVKLRIPVAHVEAGLRSRDWDMPEEINRVLTDRVSRWLFTTSKDANDNLRAEGAPEPWIHLAGNVMIDTLLANLERALEHGEAARTRLGLQGTYGLMTLHRPSNVDEARVFQRLLTAVEHVSAQVPILFPAHPRTMQQLRQLGIDLPGGLRMIDPIGYLDFVGLMAGSAVVLTDSGGIQEETSVLGIPCLTLRENTERPITCELGTNRLVGTDPDAIARGAENALTTGGEPAHIPFWDGRAGERVAAVLLRDLVG